MLEIQPQVQPIADKLNPETDRITFYNCSWIERSGISPTSQCEKSIDLFVKRMASPGRTEWKRNVSGMIAGKMTVVGSERENTPRNSRPLPEKTRTVHCAKKCTEDLRPEIAG